MWNRSAEKILIMKYYYLVIANQSDCDLTNITTDILTKLPIIKTYRLSTYEPYSVCKVGVIVTCIL